MWPWPHGLVGWSIIPCTERLQVQFLVGAHAYIAGLILSWGTYGRQVINASLSHRHISAGLFHPSFLSKSQCKHVLKKDFNAFSKYKVYHFKNLMEKGSS